MAKRDTERTPTEQDTPVDRGNEGRMPAENDQVRGIGDEGDADFDDAEDVDDEEEEEGDGSF